MLRLSCVNCGAALEIGPDLDVFACAYCGSQQRVERRGGVVALRRVETAIKAVQRGTDRTAAELALPRLAQELTAAQAERKLAVSAALEKRASAKRGRRVRTMAVFLGTLIGGSLAVLLLGRFAPFTIVAGFVYLWFVACITAPVLVFRRIRIPPDESEMAALRFDERIEKIRVQIASTRAVLDGPRE